MRHMRSRFCFIISKIYFIKRQRKRQGISAAEAAYTEAKLQEVEMRVLPNHRVT